MRWLLPVAFAAPRCVPGASEQLCRYSAETVEWLREVAEEKLSDATAKRCVEPLAKAIRRTETYEYELCSFQLVSEEEGQAFTAPRPACWPARSRLAASLGEKECVFMAFSCVFMCFLQKSLLNSFLALKMRWNGTSEVFLPSSAALKASKQLVNAR